MHTVSIARRALAATAMLLMTLLAAAAPPAVRFFDESTWARLTRQLHRPAAVVFTTTDCAYCPAVVDGLARWSRNAPGAVIVVVMDPVETPAALLNDPHYRQAQAVYVFDGAPLALRHSVDPGWRGETPFVALLARDGHVRYVRGLPDAAALGEL
ncbi:MAG: hypothetical protein NTZ79_13350 [Proteobacteria bacterium]|nr:hypothetical protein [Pseudomonadota bacterium]